MLGGTICTPGKTTTATNHDLLVAAVVLVVALVVAVVVDAEWLPWLSSNMNRACLCMFGTTIGFGNNWVMGGWRILGSKGRRICCQASMERSLEKVYRNHHFVWLVRFVLGRVPSFLRWRAQAPPGLSKKLD